MLMMFRLLMISLVFLSFQTYTQSFNFELPSLFEPSEEKKVYVVRPVRRPRLEGRRRDVLIWGPNFNQEKLTELETLFKSRKFVMKTKAQRAKAVQNFFETIRINGHSNAMNGAKELHRVLDTHETKDLLHPVFGSSRINIAPSIVSANLSIPEPAPASIAVNTENLTLPEPLIVPNLHNTIIASYYNAVVNVTQITPDITVAQDDNSRSKSLTETNVIQRGNDKVIEI
ncbi:hypothetical protein WDU94_008264 [Cyamophila willieti]